MGKKVYNLGCETNKSIKEIIQYIIEKTNSKSKIICLPKKTTLFILKILSLTKLIDFNQYHINIISSNLVLNCSRVKKDLNFSFKYSSEEIFLKAYNYYCKNYSEIKKINLSSKKRPSMRFFRFIKFLS